MSISNSVRHTAVIWSGHESERFRSIIATEDVACKAFYNQSLDVILFHLDLSSNAGIFFVYIEHLRFKLCYNSILFIIYENYAVQILVCILMHVIMSGPEDNRAFATARRKLTAMATNTPPIRTSQLCFHAIRYVWERNITPDWHIIFDCVTV